MQPFRRARPGSEFSLTLYDDDVREENETFQMLLGSSITKYLRLIGDEDEALVTIADDDFVEPTGVELALTSDNGVFDSVAENSSQHDITVTASFSNIRWPTDAADAALRPADPRDVDTTVRVKFDSANSAAAQIDLERFQVANSQGTFQDVESFDIVIPAGQTSGTTTLRFKPANDDLDEEDETVILQGAEAVASDSDEFLPVNSASFTITDDDTRGITVSPASLATGSGIGMKEGGTSTYSLVLDTEPTDTVTVTVASEQDNLIRLTPETFTFTPSNWSTTQTISVVSLDDGTDASFTEAFIAHRVSGGDYGSVSVRNITLIIENTTQAYIYLDDAQASESDGYVEFTVSVRPILRTVPVVVRYTTVDGTAAAGTDYTRQVNTGQTYKIFSIPANGGAATIRIPITDNEVYGPAKKTFTLQLTNHNNKALLDGDATSLTATGSIIDDDPKPVVSVAGPAGDLSYVSEDMKGPVTFTLTLTGRSATDVTVDYATGQAQVLSRLAARQGITPATAGEDYTAATGTVTFSPGDATKQVTVQLTDDDVSEDTEFFGFKISNAQNAQLRNEAIEEVADVGLLDDDPRGVAIDPTSISLEEPTPGEAAVASSYTVKLNSKPTDTVTVTIGGANPAVSLSGATLSNTNTLTFTTSNWDTAQTVTVTPVEDANGIAETITLTHIQSGGDYTGIAADSVTVNVTDSDTRNVVLSPTSLTVTEGDDTGVSYTVKLSTQPSDTITVTIGGHSGTDLSISGNTLSNSNTLTFSTSNWNTAQMVTVKAGHDGNADDESETLTHSASGGDYANLTKDLPVTVTDAAPATVTVSFGSAAYTVAESDDTDTTGVTENTVQVTVTLSADPERTVVIPIKKTNEGGASDSDYSGVPQSVTFDSGDTSKTFTFTAAHDTVDDDGESVKLSFGDTLPDGVTTGATDEATVTITDDDVPSVTVSFGSAAYTVAESDDTGTTNVTENTVEVTVTLSADPERTVVISIEKTNQGATTADYSGVPQNVTFDSGETSKTFTFTATHDTVDDDGESVKLSFGATLPDGVTTGTPATSAVTITDDDVPSVTVSFGAASYTVTEGSSRTVTVTLDADPERTVVIPIEAANEGGASDSDYTGVPESVTFDDGDISKSFDVSAVEDNLAESGERVKLSFGTLPADASAGAPSEASVSIHDRTQGQDLPTSPTVHFESAAYSVDEGATVAVKVKLSKAPGSEAVIPISITNRAGASDNDYTGVPDSLTFGAADTEKTITFAATDDSVDDDGEKVELSFGSLPGGITATAGEAAEAVVTITDDDKPASLTVEFEQAAYTAAEGGTVTVKVTLSDDPEMDLTIPISKTNQGGATSADYSGVPNSVTFGSGDTSKTFVFTAEADTVDDDGESVKLSFGTLPTGVTAGTPVTSAVTITDDDVPSVTVSFGSAAYTVAESDDSDTTNVTENTVEVTGTLSADPERTVVIPIEKTNQGDATTADYSGVPQNVTFDSGDTSKSFTFTAAHDTDDDDGESVKLSFGATLPTGVTAGTPATSAVTITDDDVPSVTVSFGSAAYTVAESDDSDTTDVTENTVQVTVTLSADPERTVGIPIEKTNQDGATAADYSGVPQNVTFDSGETSKTFTFTAAHDTVDDDGESVKLGFGATLPDGVSAGTTDEATVTITDDDVPSVTVSFGAASYTVTEGASRTVTVTLSADPERTVVIPIEKTNEGGATTADYSGVPQNVTFDSGESSKSFTFTAAHDTVDDDGESVNLSFGATLPTGVTAGTPATSAVTITDDDVPSVTVSFGSAAYTVAESDDSDTTNVTENTVEVTVTLSADPERTVVIPIEKAHQGGATTADYSGVPQNVTFDSGDTQKSFVFTAETDTDDDHGESVRLSFDTMPDARVSEGSPSEAMVTIRQDSTQSTADCNSAIWCADLEFKSQSLPAEMWVLDDKPLDSEFDFDYNGVTYRFGGLSVDPYGHNIPINSRPNPPFAIPERTKFNLRLLNMNASSYSLDRFRMPNDDWMNWTLHVSTAKDGEMLTAALPLSEGRFSEHYWIWYGSDLEALRAAWMEGQVYKLKIVEDPRSQRTPKVLGPPLYLKVTPYTNHTLGAWWKMPENRVDRAPPNTTYKVQWKEASDSWDNPADVSEETDSPSPATKETLFHSIRGLTGGVEYHVRVIATNTVGDSEPSEVVSGTPTPLPAAGQNIAANSPAKGAPSIEGTPEVGQTLSAVTTDITDDDGLQDVVFSYQWLPDDVEISGADGATYILTSDDLGKAINVRVDFTDNAGNEESLTSAPTAAVTAAEDLELQSATVDGSTLTLTYNETLNTSVTPPASAFVVNVNEASRSIMGAGVGGSSVLLLLSPAVETGDTVNVDYTKPSGSDVIKDTQGRQADSFTGQAVTNNTAPAETERSDPAQTPGSPTSLKVSRHESGKLLASWSAPNSGPAPTGYTVQWKESGTNWDDADDVSETNVNGTSHVITGLTDGVEYAMRVVAHKGDADGDPSGEVTATPLETVPPSPSAASVDGATLTITFDEPLDAGETPDKSAFVVAVAGSSRGVDTVSVSGSVVTLTVVTAVFAGEVVTVDYTVPADDSAARLQDLAGNAAASFSGQQVTNDTQAAAQLTASVSLVPESHDGSTVFTFGLRFSETPRKRFSYKIMRDLALTVTGGEVIKARRLAPQSNVGWEIHVRPDGNGPITIVLPVTTDCTAEGAICTEDRRPLSNRLEITVPAPGG